MLRAYTHLFNYPLTAAISSLVLLQYNNSPIALFLANLAIQKAYLFIMKLDLAITLYATAMSNMKQRFKSQLICFILQWTILLPFTFGVLVITTILDTATVPFLGFAFFVIGYPKPLRGWSNSVPVMPQLSDKLSDAFLYESMKTELASTLQRLDQTDSSLF